MASHDIQPTLDVEAGARVFAADLARALTALGAGTPADLGWRVIGRRTLLVPIGGRYAGVEDEYLLRLDFVTDRTWPPKAQFVNPETLGYVVGQDRAHLPFLNDPEVFVHPAYQRDPSSAKIQLICCSATFEYYDVRHPGEDSILWRTGDTFLQTIAAIRRGISSEHYLGRYSPDG